MITTQFSLRRKLAYGLTQELAGMFFRFLCCCCRFGRHYSRHKALYLKAVDKIDEELDIRKITK